MSQTAAAFMISVSVSVRVFRSSPFGGEVATSGNTSGKDILFPMLSSSDRVSKALDDLIDGLTPFVEGALNDAYGLEWRKTVRSSIRNERVVSDDGDSLKWDAQALLTVMWDHWNSAFRNRLGFTERSLVSELREYRNRWAHQTSFTFEDTYRILDSVERLLAASGASEAVLVRQSRRDLMHAEVTSEAMDDLLASQFKRKRLGTILIYMICSSALMVSFVATLGWKGWLLGIPVLALAVVFALISLRDTGVVFGPHECTRCGRIIYSAGCPYCDPQASSPELAANENNKVTA